MSEDSLSERLKWIRDEYFKGKAAQKRMAEAIGCEPSYISQLISGTRQNLDTLLAGKLVNKLPVDSNVTVQWLLFGGDRPVAGYPIHTRTLALRETPPEDTVVKWLLDQLNEMELRERLDEARKSERFDVVQVLAARLNRIISNKEPE